MTTTLRREIDRRVDPPYETTRVREASNGVLTTEDGWSIGIGDTPAPPGATVEFWGRGFGFPVRGIAINGVVDRYQTADEFRRSRALEARRSKAENVERYVDSRKDQDAAYDALPDVFRRRIDRFREGCPEFRWEFEPYELRVCVDAVRIAEHCDRDDKRISQFAELPSEQQRAAGIDGGHSGNSFGCAIQLARLFVTNPEVVVLAHGAMVPLVGCVDYGCTHEASS